MIINHTNNRYWQNKQGTADRPYCSCGSRKDHWEKQTYRRFPVFCCVFGCFNSAEVGAHIYRIGSSGTEYIAPFCKEHNIYHPYDKFTLELNTELVEANISKTCGR